MDEGCAKNHETSIYKFRYTYLYNYWPIRLIPSTLHRFLYAYNYTHSKILVHAGSHLFYIPQTEEISKLNNIYSLQTCTRVNKMTFTYEA
jgi:hypothetical protein